VGRGEGIFDPVAKGGRSPTLLPPDWEPPSPAGGQCFFKKSETVQRGGKTRGMGAPRHPRTETTPNQKKKKATPLLVCAHVLAGENDFLAGAKKGRKRGQTEIGRQGNRGQTPETGWHPPTQSCWCRRRFKFCPQSQTKTSPRNEETEGGGEVFLRPKLTFGWELGQDVPMGGLASVFVAKNPQNPNTAQGGFPGNRNRLLP